MIRNAVHFLGFQTIDRKRQNTFEFDRKSVFESSKFGLENGLLMVLNCILPFYQYFHSPETILFQIESNWLLLTVSGVFKIH